MKKFSPGRKPIVRLYSHKNNPTEYWYGVLQNKNGALPEPTSILSTIFYDFYFWPNHIRVLVPALNPPESHEPLR